MAPFSAAELLPDHIASAVVELVRRLTNEQPALLVVEDVHWADADTVRLLLRIASEVEELPWCVAVTYREADVVPGHPARPLIVEVPRHPWCTQISLSPLADDDVRAMVSAIPGTQAFGAGVIDAIHGRAAGNPLFVEELCTSLVEVEGLDRTRDVADIHMPLSLRETVVERLLDADPQISRVILLAAVAGDPIDVNALALACGESQGVVDAALLVGLERQLLVERFDGRRHSYTFRHALTREALLTELRGPGLREAHRRVAMALAAAEGGLPDERAGSIADHLSAAGDAAQAAAAAVRAARDAARRGAFAECERRYDQVLGLLSEDDPGQLETRVEAAEQLRSPRPEAAARHVAAGCRIAERRGDRVALARLVLVDGNLRWWRGDSDALAAAMLEAYGLVRGRGDDFELLVVLELARAHANRDEWVDALALLPRGEELIASGVGDAAMRVRLLGLRALLAMSDEEVRTRFTQALGAAREAADEPMLGLVLGDAGFADLWYLGDIASARSRLTRGREVMRLARPAHSEVYAAVLAWAEAIGGDFDTAVAHAEGLRQSDNVPARTIALIALTDVHLWRGAWSEAEECALAGLSLAERTREAQWIVPALGGVGRVRLRHGVDTGTPFMWEALRRGGGSRPHWSYSVDMARALAASGAGDELERWTSAVAEATSRCSYRFDTAALRMCEGLTALARGKASAARRALGAALESYGGIPCPTREAQAHLALADLELREQRRSESIAAATAARTLGERLGAPGLLAEATAGLRRCGVRAIGWPQAPVQPAGTSALSRRELEIATLVAEGFSNADIGKRLFLSERTVESHVSHILGKLDLSRRAQIQRWIAEARPLTS